MIDIPDSFFPKDSDGQPLCPKCQQRIALCDCPVIEPKTKKVPKILPKIRLERNGRKGKVVTLIENLPANEVYLKDWAKKLKVQTGSGGTYYIEQGMGIIEIQGSHREIISRLFK